MALYELIDATSPEPGMVFAGPKDDVDKLTDSLGADTHPTEFLEPIGKVALATEVSQSDAA